MLVELAEALTGEINEVKGFKARPLKGALAAPRESCRTIEVDKHHASGSRQIIAEIDIDVAAGRITLFTKKAAYDYDLTDQLFLKRLIIDLIKDTT